MDASSTRETYRLPTRSSRAMVRRSAMPSLPFDTPAAPLDADDAASRKRWRWVVFAATWIAYAAFYLTRKNYAIAQPQFIAELGWTKAEVGRIVTSYLTAYAIGQFVLGALGDRIGARVLLAFGFAATAALSATLGFA